MKFEITENLLWQITDMKTNYCYDLYINDIFISHEIFDEKQEPFRVLKHFIDTNLKDWRTKYNVNKVSKQEMMKRLFHNATIISEDIQDIDLMIKKVEEFDRLQKMKEDFNETN